MFLDIGGIQYPSLKGKVSEEEWSARVNLAAICRLIPLMGWDDLSMQLVSARVGDEYLFIPNGVLFEEITASSLVKITLEGEVTSDTPFGIVHSTWYPMKAVHAVRPDANFLIHTHDTIITALAARKCGLLPVSQPAIVALADGISYHDYDGVETYESKMYSLQDALGPKNGICLLRNHGLITLGVDARVAFLRHYLVRKACHIQVLAGDSDQLIHLPDEMIMEFRQELARFGKGQGTTDPWAGLIRKISKQDSSFAD